MVAIKRKWGANDSSAPSDLVAKPAPGTKSFASGSSVRDGLATGTRQALVSFQQQILTLYSALPLAINHPTVVILQHYIDVSPTCDEIFNAWKLAESTRNEKLAETSALLLASVIRILTPLPYFHTQLVAIVSKLISPTEQYNDLLGRLLQSGKREQVLAGLHLASAAVHVDKPDPASLVGGSTRGRLAIRVWSTLVEGGSVKGLGKMLGMRRRTKEGAVEYGDKDPLDRPDIRHLAIHLVLPLFPTTIFATHAKGILSNLYPGLPLDPPTTVYRVLDAMWRCISAPPPGIARRIALVLLDESAIDHMVRLLDRHATEPTTSRTVAEMTEGFLEAVTTTPGRGICFPDQGWYPRKEEGEDDAEAEAAANGSGLGVGVGVDPRSNKTRRGLHNRILSNVVRRLGAKVVDDEGRVGSWALKLFQACPELVAGYWPHSALSLEPRLDAKWIATMAYVGRIISLPVPERTTFNQPIPKGSAAESMPPRPFPPSVTTIVESVLPSPLTKQHLSKGLQHTDALVQHVTALALARALQKLEVVQRLFQSIEAELDSEPGVSAENPWARRRRELEIECRKRVPEVPVVIAFAQRAAAMAPSEPETEAERALAARSAMLTESALRLFGLYHKTLPSLASEARFDVGKLLVSASSANAERRARREAREGSVISDSGSVGSIGTLGTVGMGGGFGHTRGDVEGFEALSQLHVLRLLSQVRDWSWTNKAAGSQYTYLYHILQLHLSTRNVITQVMTTTLLHRILVPSLLFEHDDLELPIWLEALPRASETVSGPMFIAQQIYLLSFIDECVRRCIKTPHRYIEEAAAALAEINITESLPQDQIISPLIMTVVEQLHAKVMGQLIATEAAAVVLNYLRRVLVGLLGKQRDAAFIRAIVSRVEATVTAAREAGQPRHGLSEIVASISADLDIVFIARASPAVLSPEIPRLTDQDDWIHRSFESQCIASFSADDDDDVDTGALVSAIGVASNAERARQAQFLVHFLAHPTRLSKTKRTVLGLLAACLESATDDTTGQRLKASIFNDAAVRDLFLTSTGDVCRPELVRLACLLDAAKPFDSALAEHYTHMAVTTLEDKRAEDIVVLPVLQPWIKFLSPAQVELALPRVIRRATKAAKKSSPLPNASIAVVLSDLVVAAKSPATVYPHLAPLLSLGAYRPVTRLLRASVATSLHRRLDVAITPDIVSGLVGKGDDDAYDLVALLVSRSSSAAESFSAVLKTEWLNDPRVLPVINALTFTAAMPLSVEVIRATVSALCNPVLTTDIHLAATTLLAALAKTHAEDVNAALATVQLRSFGLPLARAAAELASMRDYTVVPGLTSLLDLGLQYATRRISSDAPLAGDELETIAFLDKCARIATAATRLELNVGLVEPVITAVVAERLDVAPVVEFSALLASKAMLKAGFVRQQLQLLISSKALSKMSQQSADPAQRLAFIRLVHALFLASTYVSCQPNFIEPLVPLYRGTLSTADRLVLSLFQAFETHRKLSVTSVLRHWSPAGSISQRAFDALTSLDAQKVFATCTAFPLTLKFVDDVTAPVTTTTTELRTEDTYDPVFVLSLFTAALQEELTGMDWVEILRSNTLGMAVVALASRDEGMRKVAGYVLARATTLISAMRFQEQLQLQHTLELVQHAIPAPDTDDSTSKQPRLPTLIALFIAHALRSLAHPSHFLYPIASRFLLQRPTLDAFDVPALYAMLYATSDGFKRERAWIVRLLRDGVRSEEDWRILKRRNTFSLIASLFQASVDPSFRRLVLQALNSMTRVPAASRTLATRHSVVPWLTMQWDLTSAQVATSRNVQEEKDAVLALLENVVIGAGPSLDLDDARKLAQARWVKDAERLVLHATPGSSLDRLETLARIALRLATLPSSTSSRVLLPSLVEHVLLVTLETKSASSATSTTVVEYLFRMSLTLPVGPLDAAVINAVNKLGKLVAALETPVGEWARKEAQRVESSES